MVFDMAYFMRELVVVIVSRSAQSYPQSSLVDGNASLHRLLPQSLHLLKGVGFAF